MNKALMSMLGTIECDEDGNPTPESLQVARETARSLGMDDIEREIDEIEMRMYRKRAEEDDA